MSIITLLVIYLYKKLTEILLKLKPTTNICILLLLLKIDKAKLFLIYFVAYMHAKLFDLLKYANHS